MKTQYHPVGGIEETAQPRLSKEDILLTIGTDDLGKQQSVFEAELEAKYDVECEKARKRAERFGVEYKAPDKKALFEAEYKRVSRMRPDEGFFIGMDLASEEEQAKIEARRAKFGDSEVYLKAQEDAEEEAKKAQRAERFGITLPGAKLALLRKMGLYPMQVYLPDEDRTDLASGFAEVEPNKIHLFALDKGDFKCIRSGDVLKFFDSYFPRYVEWLGDTAANIIFDDAIAAQRALEATSFLLPPVEEVMNLQEYEGEFNEAAKKGKAMEKPEDISVFGWRLGCKRILKSKTDAWGERGTAVRVLLRLATTFDVLKEKPAKPREENDMEVEIVVENEYALRLAKRKERKRGRKSGEGGAEGEGGEEDGVTPMEADENDGDRPNKLKRMMLPNSITTINTIIGSRKSATPVEMVEGEGQVGVLVEGEGGGKVGEGEVVEEGGGEEKEVVVAEEEGGEWEGGEGEEGFVEGGEEEGGVDDYL